MPKIRSLALIELTALFDLYDITYSRPKRKKKPKGNDNNGKCIQSIIWTGEKRFVMMLMLVQLMRMGIVIVGSVMMIIVVMIRALVKDHDGGDTGSGGTENVLTLFSKYGDAETAEGISCGFRVW